MTPTEHRTSWECLEQFRYRPVCSCGWRGHGDETPTAVGALMRANAHAREQGAVPQPPDD